MASRVTKEGRRDRRFSNQAKGFRQQVYEQGGTTPVRQGLSEMPLTLWIITAAIVLYLYIRRARLGIDQHPAEKVAQRTPAPKVQPKVAIPERHSGWSPWVGRTPALVDPDRKWDPIFGNMGDLARDPSSIFGRN